MSISPTVNWTNWLRLGSFRIGLTHPKLPFDKNSRTHHRAKYSHRKMSNLIPNQPDYSNNYSENELLEKLTQFAKSAGRELVEKALILYNAASDPDTPQKAKAIIFSALGYFILPLDAIPDITPLLGFSDDLGAIALALATVAAHIKPQHRLAAKEKTNKWFGESD